ncbi:MAG: hypothetical protein JRH05_05360 [Deltaproteobacteria bacterium]|nr:hypothetical protein [Deltaproteobacteria bacterium]
MSAPNTIKNQLMQFGRNIALLFNRATMYDSSHPYVAQSIDLVHQTVEPLLEHISPLVFILNRGQFFIDEEPLDPRVNVGRIVAHFKKAGIQSISFEKGVDKNDIRIFLEIISSLNRYPNADAMKDALAAKGVDFLKINHVFYKKVTEDDEVISKEALKKVTPAMMEEDHFKSKKMFIEALLESVLTEEFVKTLNIENLVKNPAGLTRNMIQADLNGGTDPSPEEGGEGFAGAPGGNGLPGGGKATAARAAGAGPARPVGGAPGGTEGMRGHGAVLFKQLEVIEQEVEKNLAGQGGVELSELASAVFEMKQQLVAGIQAQKALGVSYENQEEILEKSNEITDRVLLSLIREEYQAGRISTSRLAQILRRLVPDAAELRRLLPKIKEALLEEGMPLAEYLKLVHELGRELQSEGLAKIIQESSEQIGVDGEEILAEVKRNPSQAAELIYLAAEIRKGTGDEKVLSDLLVDYVERLGSRMGAEMTEAEEEGGGEHLQKVMADVKSGIVRKLARMEVKDDVLARLEEKLNKRVDDMLDNLRLEWLKSQGAQSEKAPVKRLSVLQTLERSVSENEELGEILKVVRSKVEAGEIDENDFRQIHTEILAQKQRIKDRESGKGLPSGILKLDELIFFLDKEIARAKRYNTPFAALGFSLVKAKARVQEGLEKVNRGALMDALLQKLAAILRETDVLGQIGRKRVVALLPMTFESAGKLALRRSMKLLHVEPLDVGGIPVDIKVAGVVAKVNLETTQDARAFLETLGVQLSDMAARIKNIHAYF